MDAKQKPGIVVVFTGAGKGKTSASLGLIVRALGAGLRVANIQFIKSWQTNEDRFLAVIADHFSGQLHVYKGGKGFYHAGALSAPGISDAAHRQAAKHTYQHAFQCVASSYDVVICDEINAAVAAGLLPSASLLGLIQHKKPGTSLCLTGRGFPPALLPYVDIATDMHKLKHHFDTGFIANPGIDY
jgi:cob(I)alamin adenosyltransferase